MSSLSHELCGFGFELSTTVSRHFQIENLNGRYPKLVDSIPLGFRMLVVHVDFPISGKEDNHFPPFIDLVFVRKCQRMC